MVNDLCDLTESLLPRIVLFIETTLIYRVQRSQHNRNENNKKINSILCEHNRFKNQKLTDNDL